MTSRKRRQIYEDALTITHVRQLILNYGTYKYMMFVINISQIRLTVRCTNYLSLLHRICQAIKVLETRGHHPHEAPAVHWSERFLHLEPPDCD